MQPHDAESAFETFNIEKIFEQSETDNSEQIFNTARFTRECSSTPDKDTVILDRFPDTRGVSCCFLRLSPGKPRTVRLLVCNVEQLESCAAGGWLLKPGEETSPSYWIPQAPILRTLDSAGRILSENPAAVVEFGFSPNALSVKIEIRENMYLDLTVWRIDSQESAIKKGLEHPLTLEKQPIFFWNSQTTYQAPADVYLYLVYGHVYVNRFIWPRKWKINSELDAYELFVTLSGLENSTHKKLYNLIKRQILFSVIDRQAQDGGWYHGEWTDAMESHYRFHNGAVLLLEAALEENFDDVVYKSLQRAASFASSHTDNTDLGLWFLHDSLEDSVEGMNACWEQTGGPWIPGRVLGKSITNKMILNTHLDSIVVLDRYQEVSGDDQYAGHVSSARSATRKLLALRPAEQLYRIIYWCIDLTLLPTPEAKRLSVPKRAIKRLTWKYLIPRLRLIKQKFPRFVMPGGFIERHLAPPHWGVGYFPVNIMDLARFWRRFPGEDLADIIDDAVRGVSETGFLQYCAEEKPRRYALVVYIDALYQLYSMNRIPGYRRYLAEAIISAEDAGLGLPPSSIGADPEALKKSHQQPCPSPKDKRLRVANLISHNHRDLLIVNNTTADLQLEFEGIASSRFDWMTADDQPFTTSTPLYVPRRGWIWGREG